MRGKKIFAIVIGVVGLVMIGISMYITKQVEEGKIQVARAERTVRQGSALFSLNPTTEQVGRGITASADRKIDRAKGEIITYTNLAQLLMVGGVVVVIVGLGMFVLVCRGKR